MPADPQLVGYHENPVNGGYNHSGWLNGDCSHYYLAYETHGVDLRAIDVTDPCSPEEVASFDAGMRNDWENMQLKRDLVEHIDVFLET